ncbi:uncharacterized protein isoform X2 [Choristoneura fumiferana]|uniref:uncharacterized protein isoform X2 n=1 Tax=Choristoneura fumiferana TaxID=7141 RepID=UPI003D159602
MMACVENIPPVHADSEREEGEIVDELDELSDISSEEEFLLRQRLQVLENYNNVLERKKAKRSSIGPGKNGRHNDALLCDLSEISATELEEPYVYKDNKEQRHLKSYHRPKRRKDPSSVSHPAKREHRKKSHKSKKKIVLSESSDESEDEYRNKRRKLANAVAVSKTNIDKTSLKARLTKMFLRSQNQEDEKLVLDSQTENQQVHFIDHPLEKIHGQDASIGLLKDLKKDNLMHAARLLESVDLCSDTEVKNDGINANFEKKPFDNIDTVDSATKVVSNGENIIINKTQTTRDSDEDLELLREHALKTKASKAKIVSEKSLSGKEDVKQKEYIEDKNILLISEDEDSDTAELRTICLKSALLKRAIEIKQKQKLRKRLSQSSNLNDELMNDQTEYMNQIMSENNTDIESVDMDIGSDVDDKNKEYSIEPLMPTDSDVIASTESNVQGIKKSNEDELEEDEDLLRAKLLTSLSKNLPNLVDPNIIKNIKHTEIPKKDAEIEKQVNNLPEEKRFIISLGNSDSEGEHEATKNLTKMHMKLSEQVDFQQKLDLFLKSTRMQVEKGSLPDVVQQPLVTPAPKPKEKFVPKTVKHLPKSEQIEYKNLVKRMAELEKMKNARQSSLNINKGNPLPKDTLKPRNVTIESQKLTENVLNEQIALSRKTIAEESAKVLKLKEEAMNLSQKYKIVATELRNIATAITFNKREQKSAQIRLSKIRAQHQLLLNSSTTSKHSIMNGNLVHNARVTQKLVPTTNKRLQKENNPKEDVKNPKILKSVQVSVVNDLKEEENVPNPRLSIHVEVTNNKKTVKIPQSPVKDHNYAIENSIEPRINDDSKNILVGNTKEIQDSKEIKVSSWGSKSKTKEVDDYTSPLQALGTAKCIHRKSRKCACFNYRFRQFQ